AAQSQVPFTPATAPGFTFGPETWLLDDGPAQPARTLSGGGEARADEKGFLAIALGNANAPGGRAWEYTVEAEVADVNRRRLTNRAQFVVHPAAWYVGLRAAGTGFFETGKPATVEALAVTVDGERKVGAPITLELRRREWKSIRRKGYGGSWYADVEPVETRVAEASLTSAAEPVRHVFTPAEPGMYVAEAKTRDDAGREQLTRTSFYVVGPGWVSWQRDATDRIDLVADKPQYDVGETAKILIKNPWPEAEAIVTVEREGVRSVRHLRLTSAATVVDVPLEAEALPNVFVGALLFRGRVKGDGAQPAGDDPGRPAVAAGYVQLNVEKKSKRLQVTVTPDAAEKRPGQKLSVALKVADAAGRGVKSELAVWAVDEGVLRLTDYRAPDALESFHGTRGLAVVLGEPLLHLVLRRNYSEKGATAGGSGGGDASGAGFRSNFKTTAVFAPHVETNAAGEATVELTLPDNLTTFRVMALAATTGDQTGTGEARVVVSKPLLAMPALPRTARVGDEFEAGVVLYGKGRAFPDVKVTAQAEGLLLKGSPEQQLGLEDGKPREVRFRFAATAPGLARLRFSVEGGGERDGVEQRLPITLPTAMEAVAAWGETREKATEALVPPEGVRADIGGLELTLASTALGGYDAAMQQLVEYPYGCLEQLSSRLVPFIALRELHGKFPDAGGMKLPAQDVANAWLGGSLEERFSTGDPDEVVRRTVKAIEQLQNHDGGYRYWASNECASGWASAYAVLALARAKEVGYPVDAAALQKGLGYLAQHVASGTTPRCGYAPATVDDATRVFALYVLARSREPKPSWYGELYARRDQLPLFGKAMLADAMFVGGGDRNQAKALLQELWNHAKETANELHLEEKDAFTYASLWSSDTRTTALALQTLTTISPEHPYVAKMSRYLGGARQKSGAYRNTQEAAFSLMALADLVRTREKDAPDFLARVALGGEPLAEERFEGRTLSPRKVAVPIAKLAERRGRLPLEFAKEGPGVLYYGALLRYAPKELPQTPLDRGLVVQRWFEPYTGGGQARRFFAGELVRVRVRVGTHLQRSFVAVEIPLPAGLEPVDTSLASTARLPQSPADEEGVEPDYEYESADDVPEALGPWATRFYSPFNHTELRDDRVLLFADELPPGVHVASFVARATSPGTFLLPPARAEEMYAPENFGRSDGGTFEIALPSPVAGRTE
ncbi:MAG: alpha-2-macroglobulin family protein, partial [Myxococcales bacterium]